MASTSDGATLINEYYKTAPLIVDQINKRENSDEIYSNIYAEIKKAASLIENKMYSTAFEFYCKIVSDLKRDFLVN